MKTAAALLLLLAPALLALPVDKIREYARRHPNLDHDNPEYGNAYQGDILLREGQTAEASGPLNAIPQRYRRWPNGVLYYEIRDPSYSEEQKELIRLGVEDLVKSTMVNGVKCVDIREKDSSTYVRDYVYIVDNGGCSSYLGVVGGGQRMSLAPGCITRHGTIMHEFLHALGFHHEHKRSDRDDYVYVNFDNIQPGMEHNFNKLEEGVTVDLLGTAYDYGSVMHYSAYGFAIDKSIPTIIPHDPEAEIGQRLIMSKLDIERVQIFYECLKPEDSVYFKHLAGKRI